MGLETDTTCSWGKAGGGAEPCFPGRTGDEGLAASRAGEEASPEAGHIVHRAKEGQESQPAARGPAPLCAGLESAVWDLGREESPEAREVGSWAGGSHAGYRPQFWRQTSDPEREGR